MLRRLGVEGANLVCLGTGNRSGEPILLEVLLLGKRLKVLLLDLQVGEEDLEGIAVLHRRVLIVWVEL